jgi:mRNA interferase MazF
MIIMMPPKTSYKRGGVVLVLYPNSDLRSAKTRPALVVRVSTPIGQRSGLLSDSVVMTANLATFRAQRGRAFTDVKFVV